MERKRPYWQVAVSLMFSILATAAFIILGVKAIGFLMPFVVGWIISAIATPLVNWLEKRLKIVKKLGTAMIVIMVIGLIVLVGYFAVSRIAAEVTDLIQNFPEIQREEVIAWFHKIAPPSVEKRMILVMDNLKYAVGGYFKAQFKIMGVVFLILFAGFLVLGIHYAVLVAFLISFLDFLPFFGTGTALIPWAIYSVFIGEYKITAGLVIIYAVSQIVRQLLQPKLVGDSMGMNPLVTLLLLYVGYKIKGVFGMILAVPLGLVLINMCQAGAFDYILDDVKILVEGILGLREELPQGQKENSDNT